MQGICPARGVPAPTLAHADRMVLSMSTRSLRRTSHVQAKDLNAQVERFRSRPLDAGPYTFVAADALLLKVRENGRVVNVHILVAVG
jgi:transposase-like protein